MLGLIVRKALVDVDGEAATQLMNGKCMPFEICQICRAGVSERGYDLQPTDSPTAAFSFALFTSSCFLC